MLLACTACLVGASPAAASEQAGDGRPPLRQEYFVQQEAGEGVLIRVNAFEAVVAARVGTLDTGLLLDSAVEHSRLAPLFQFVDAPDRARQLDIEVEAGAYTDRTRFDLEMARLVVRDERSAALARAYELLSFGLERPPSDTPANWSVKVNSLINAARLFGQFGMEELRLWTRFHTASLTLHELGDLNLSLDLARELAADPGIGRQPLVLLAARQLEIEALAGLAAAGGSGVELQDVAAEAARAAERRGQDFEAAAALRARARDLAASGRSPEALAQYREALATADRIGADALATEIREALVSLHGARGEVAATQEVLEAIEEQLSEDGAGEELAQNLLAQGRLLNRGHLYPDAIDVLERALAYERNSVTRAQVQLELAEALYGAGRAEEALVQARAAVVVSETGEFRRATPVLDVAAGLAVIAGAARQLGDFETMERARSAQGELADGEAARSAWRWERVLDAQARGDSVTAGQRLGALADATEPWRQLADIQRCALGAACQPARARSAFEALADSARPRDAAEARYLWAGYLRRSGEPGAALEQLDELVREIAFLRHRWPGVLGSWWWWRGSAVLDDYLSLSMVQAPAEGSLLHLARARDAASAGGADAARLEPDTEFRERLARHASGRSRGAEARELAQRLAAERDAWRSARAYLSEQGVNGFLDTLSADEALLDFCFCGGRARLLEARGGRVRRHDLGAAAPLEAMLDDLSRHLPVLAGEAFAAATDSAGEALLAPLAGRLPARIYWIGGGPLARVPPAALRRGGAFLAERHELVELVDFPARPGPGRRLRMEAPGRVFLAGGPSDYSGEYLERLEPDAELRAVTERFVGPGLRLVQGNALLRDEFEEPGALDADLAHWTMPAVIDWAQPARSAIQLSEPGREQGRQRLEGAELAQWRPSAALLVLSRAEMRGFPAQPFSVRPPLVAELLDAGAGAVLSTAWPGTDAAAARFFGLFYDALGRDGDAAQALAQAQRASLAAGDTDWARYRLYLR